MHLYTITKSLKGNFSSTLSHLRDFRVSEICSYFLKPAIRSYKQSSGLTVFSNILFARVTLNRH